MKLMEDLNFIESAIELTAKALIEKDVKRAEACISAIQNYLNVKHHPLGYFSAAVLYTSCEN